MYEILRCCMYMYKVYGINHIYRVYYLVGALELAIQGNSPYVEQCIVFGAGRPQIGCLLLLSELGKDLYKDREAFMKKVWPVIEEANAQAPTHSRILPEMVYILEQEVVSACPDMCH